MVITFESVATLASIYLQTLGLSLAFVGAGCFLHERLLSRQPSGIDIRSDGISLRWGRAYFLGLSVFLLLFLFISRLIGTGSGLGLTLALMGAASLFQLNKLRGRSFPFRRVGTLFIVLLGLIFFYSITNLALWLHWYPLGPITPHMISHFGSIHSGRYANYAIFIAEAGRIPFLNQNSGQSILTSVHLLLGTDSPLAALMVWVPFSLSFLTLLVFGVFRSGAFRRVPCLGATFLVLFCNVALSAVHVLVFDNGSPLAFVGYTDMIVAVATFILLCQWFQVELVRDDLGAATRLLLPALLGITWCWYAPQNVVIALLTCAATALVWSWKKRSKQPSRLLRGGLVFVLGVCIGATQLGPFLPSSLREEVGVWTITPLLPSPLRKEVGGWTVHGVAGITIRPSVRYLISHWTKNPYLLASSYRETYVKARTIGWDEVYRRLVWLFEGQFWASVRGYGFPLLGCFLLWLYLRRPRGELDRQRLALSVWLLLSLFAFGFGYAIFFSFALDGMKWWLARFLVPGSTMALICLSFVALHHLQNIRPVARKALWIFLVVTATWGPVVELASVGFRNFVASAHVDPIGRRLNLLVDIRGPFLFRSLLFDPDSAAPLEAPGFLVGGARRRQGLALYSRPFPLRAGSLSGPPNSACVGKRSLSGTSNIIRAEGANHPSIISVGLDVKRDVCSDAIIPVWGALSKKAKSVSWNLGGQTYFVSSVVYCSQES